MRKIKDNADIVEKWLTLVLRISDNTSCTPSVSDDIRETLMVLRRQLNDGGPLDDCTMTATAEHVRTLTSAVSTTGDETKIITETFQQIEEGSTFTSGSTDHDGGQLVFDQNFDRVDTKVEEEEEEYSPCSHSTSSSGRKKRRKPPSSDNPFASRKR